MIENNKVKNKRKEILKTINRYIFFFQKGNLFKLLSKKVPINPKPSHFITLSSLLHDSLI